MVVEFDVKKLPHYAALLKVGNRSKGKGSDYDCGEINGTIF